MNLRPAMLCAAGALLSKSAIEKNLEAWLPRMVKPDSRVYFYFSGHDGIGRDRDLRLPR